MGVLKFSRTTPEQQQQLSNLAGQHGIYAELSSNGHTVTFYGLEPEEIDPIARRATSLGNMDVEANGESWRARKP